MLIAVALLPPIVNCGVCLALAGVWQGLAGEYFEGPDGGGPGRLLRYSGYSGAIFLSNFLIMVATGIVFFRIKGVVPSASDWAISHVRCKTLSGFPNELLSSKKDALALNDGAVDAVVGTELTYRDADDHEPTLPPILLNTPPPRV